MSITLPVAVNAKDWQEGAADAPVTLVEYGDFQCGDCREAYYVLKTLREQQAGNMRFVYRHMPLTDIHPLRPGCRESLRGRGAVGQVLGDARRVIHKRVAARRGTRANGGADRHRVRGVCGPPVR